MFPSLVIFGLTIAGIIFRPRRQSEAVIACIGAAAMVLTGVLTFGDAASAVLRNLNVLGFFLGLMVVTAIAEEAGVVESITRRAAKLSRGDGRRLLLIVFGVGIIITSLLSNDATALILTPVVYVLVSRLKLDPLPYVFACAFIANAASMLLPVANPVNLLAVDAFDLRLGDYLAHLLLPTIIVVSVTIGLFFFIFRREIRTSFDPATLATNGPRPFMRPAVVVLAVIVAGYALFSMNGWPLSIPVLFGALFLLIIGSTAKRIDWRKLSRSISWPILPFIAALTVLVEGLENSGVTDRLGELFSSLLGRGELAASLATSLGTAAGANVINNWPAMMVSVTTLSGVPDAVTANPGLPYQAILGAGLGPNIAVLGSLSTMIWLVLLRRRGLAVSSLSYLKLGLVITPAALLIGSLALYLLS